MGSSRFVFLFASLTVAMSLSSYAQVADSDGAPAHLSYVDGEARIDRDNDSDPAAAGMPFIPGDRVTTERGRVEILFPDGSAVDVDQGSILELQAPDLVRLTRGRIVMVVARGTGDTVLYAVDTPAASINLDVPGEYRITASSGASQPQTALAVVRGSAALINDVGTEELRAGQRSMAIEGSAPSRPESFNSARADAFFEWAASRRDDRFASRSRDHLPDDLRPYASELERNGDWGYESGYGNVWYPNVEADWQPYSDGYWSPLPTYGWTWVGVTPWSWPTHHYGRWGYGGTRWFWIPERRWAPSWVSWGAASGYVSWSPLGYDNRPVFAWSAGYSSHWKGWTVLPRERFVSGRGFARQFAVKPGGLPQRTAFMTSNKAPVLPPRVATRQLVGGSRGDRRDGRDGPRDRAFPRTSPSGNVTGVPSASPKFAPPADRIDGNRDRPARDVVPGARRVEPAGAPAELNGSRKEFRDGGSRMPRPTSPDDRRRMTPEAPAPPKAEAVTPRPPDPRRGNDFRNGKNEWRVYPRGGVMATPPPTPPANVQPPSPAAKEPRGPIGPYRGYGDKGRADTPTYAPRQAPSAAAPPAERVAPRAEPRGYQRQESAPPAAGKTAQPQSSGGQGKGSSEGKGSSQGGARGGGGSGKGKH